MDTKAKDTWNTASLEGWKLFSQPFIFILHMKKLMCLENKVAKETSVWNRHGLWSYELNSLSTLANNTALAPCDYWHLTNIKQN